MRHLKLNTHFTMNSGLLISIPCFSPGRADYWGTVAPMLRKNEVFTGPNPITFEVDLTADPTKLDGPRVGLAPTGKCNDLGDGTPLTLQTQDTAYTFSAGPFTKPTQQVLCFKPTISSMWYEQESPMAVLTVNGMVSSHIAAASQISKDLHIFTDAKTAVVLSVSRAPVDTGDKAKDDMSAGTSKSGKSRRRGEKKLKNDDKASGTVALLAGEKAQLQLELAVKKPTRMAGFALPGQCNDDIVGDTLLDTGYVIYWATLLVPMCFPPWSTECSSTRFVCITTAISPFQERYRRVLLGPWCIHCVLQSQQRLWGPLRRAGPRRDGCGSG